jgi:hypothetical protein
MTRKKEWAAQMAEREMLDISTLKQYFMLSSFNKAEVRNKFVGRNHTRLQLVDTISETFREQREHFWHNDLEDDAADAYYAIQWDK